MAGTKVDLSDYVTVPERIEAFRTQWPDGRLTRVGPDGTLVPLDFMQVAGAEFVVYTAFCYRSPEDETPGVGTAWEPIPGLTPYTRGSEVQNAETSAWGRAIVARLDASTQRGIASREEVILGQAKQTPRDWVTEANRMTRADDVLNLWRVAKANGADPDVLDRLGTIGAGLRELEGSTMQREES